MRKPVDKKYTELSYERRFGFYLICFHITWLTYLLVMQILSLWKVGFGSKYSLEKILLNLEAWLTPAKPIHVIFDEAREQSWFNLILGKDALTFTSLSYIILAALVVGILVNVAVLTKPALNTEIRYTSSVFGMYVGAWFLFCIPFTWIIARLKCHNEAVGIIAKSATGHYLTFNFRGAYWNVFLYAVSGSCIPACLSAGFYLIRECETN